MPTIHPTSLVDPQADIAQDAVIGAFCIIEKNVRIGAGCTIQPRVTIHANTQLGEGNFIGMGTILGAPPQDLHFSKNTPTYLHLGNHNTLREYVTIHRASKEGKATRIGNHNFLMTGVHLAHDVQMADACILANNVLLGGHVQVESAAFLGGGGAFHQFVRIGKLAIVQGNATISQDVPPFCMAYGANRLAGLNVIGLRRQGFLAQERKQIKKLYSLLLQSGIPLSKAIQSIENKSLNDNEKHFVSFVQSPSKKGIMRH